MDVKSDPFSVFEQKMRAAGMKEAPIRAFRHSYASLKAGDSGLIPEDSIETIGRNSLNWKKSKGRADLRKTIGAGR